jgi:hypothetical protein
MLLPATHIENRLVEINRYNYRFQPTGYAGG